MSYFVLFHISGGSETSRSAEKLARELNTRKDHLVNSVSDYQNLLQMIISYLRKLKDVRAIFDCRRRCRPNSD